MQRAQQTLQTVLDAAHSHDLGHIEALVAADYEFLDVPTGTVTRGRDGLRRLLTETWNAFPDYRAVSPRVIGDESVAALETVIAGTHSGCYLGLPATGRHVEFAACLIYEFNAEGVIARERMYYDLEGLRGLLGP